MTTNERITATLQALEATQRFPEEQLERLRNTFSDDLAHIRELEADGKLTAAAMARKSTERGLAKLEAGLAAYQRQRHPFAIVVPAREHRDATEGRN